MSVLTSFFSAPRLFLSRRAARNKPSIPHPTPWNVRAADAEAQLPRVEAFLEALSSLESGAWASIGRSLAVEPPGVRQARYIVRSRVAGVIAERGLALSAWRVGDAVDTVAFLAMHPPRRCLRSRERRAMQATRSLASDLALALLVRPYAAVADVSILFEPFALHARNHGWSIHEMLGDQPHPALVRSKHI